MIEMDFSFWRHGVGSVWRVVSADPKPMMIENDNKDNKVKHTKDEQGHDQEGQDEVRLTRPLESVACFSLPARPRETTGVTISSFHLLGNLICVLVWPLI